MNGNTYLTLSWSTSRGRDTYGYNICRLDDTATGKRYRTAGGGYDMIGTVIGEWLADVHQERLSAIADRAGSWCDKANGYQHHRNEHGNPARGYFYGMVRNDDTGRISLDGACGVRCMTDVAAAIGLDMQWVGNRRGQTIGYLVRDRAAQVAA